MRPKPDSNLSVVKNTFRAILTLSLVVAIFVVGETRPLATGKVAGPELADQPVSQYKLRRQKLMEKIADGVIVLFGEREDDSSGVDGKFRQKDNFMYLTGVEVPGSVLILVPYGYKGAKEWLFIPPRNPSSEQWTGPQPDLGSESEQAFGIEKVVSSRGFNDTLYDILSSEEFLKAGGALYTITPPQGNARLAREFAFVESIKKTNPKTRVNAIAPLIAEMRMVKGESEIALIQRAIDITGKAHSDVLNKIKPGMFEYELEGIIMGNFYGGGAQRAAFPCIVGSGIFSTVLHYERNRKKIDDGDLVVIDIGAEYSYYAADVTRTYPASGKFTKRQRDIYKLVLEAQTAAAKSFKPGQSTTYDLQEEAKRVMKASSLRDSKGRTLDLSFIHGLSHFLGMYVHDVGDYSRPLPPGAVFTIEPGIYLPDEKLGVRIEDDYLVTEQGLVKLSKNNPSDPDEIEKLMANRK
jgi:Xaa-Pro aminopeptidase